MYVLQEEELTQPIHFAAQHGKCDVVRGLITEYGIDPTSKAVVSYYQAYCMCGLHWFSVKMTFTANQSFFNFTGWTSTHSSCCSRRSCWCHRIACERMSCATRYTKRCNLQCITVYLKQLFIKCYVEWFPGNSFRLPARPWKNTPASCWRSWN